MNVDNAFPLIGGDPELLNQLIADKIEFKRTKPTSVSPHINRRSNTRYDLTLPVVCFPMLSSFEVDQSRRVDGIVVDISERGIAMNVATHAIQPGELWVIAIEVEKTGWRFLDLRVVDTSPCGQNSTFTNGSFDGPLRRLFNDDMVLPVLDPQTYQYRLPFGSSVLTSLCAIGAAQRVVMDNVLVCPDCGSIPTVRRGCSICLSNETGKSKMIHHFACAHVDFVERFDHGDEIVCPKCLGRKMIIGADYEYLEGPTQCFECGHNDLEEILIGHCLNCSNRFPFESAKSTEIVGYRVNRLDPLALLNTA